MSLLNGGLAKAKGLSGADLDWSFIDSISRTEWEAVTTYLGNPDLIRTISAVADLRTLHRYPLPVDHPLNPASRYTEAAS